MKKCVDEGMLQAYLDGELSQEAARETASHIAECEACAVALAEAGSETSFFAAAFAPDASLNVPTAELRARVNAAVARLESSADAGAPQATGWSFSSFVASLSALFTCTPERAAAFASVAAVIAFALIFFAARPGPEAPKKIASAPASGEANKNAVKAAPSPAESLRPSETGDASIKRTEEKGTEVKVVPKSKGGANRRKAAPFTPVPAPRLEKFVPGERDYQTVIAKLDRTIKANGDAVLKPSVRADYERNIAVLDRAIEETRRVALKDPKDKDAVNFLLAAYQSKVALMTTVSDNAQVATLDR